MSNLEPRSRGDYGTSSSQLFLTGAGWITFDSTNRAVGGHNLIPVAVGRIIDQVMPLTGTFVGTSEAYQGMSVEVQVTS